MNPNSFINNGMKFLISLFLVVLTCCLCACKTREINPVWNTEIRWCYAINFKALTNNSLYFIVDVAGSDSLQNIDFETLKPEERTKYIRLKESSVMRSDTLCINVFNGKYIQVQEKYFKPFVLKELCSPGIVTNIFIPNKCEIEIREDYRGFRITIEVKKYIWRSDNNSSFTFLIYTKDKLVSKVPIKIFGGFGNFIISEESIFYSWGPRYGKHFISKYNFEDLIRNSR